MTKLITIPKFAEDTGLPYRLCLQLVGTGQIPSVAVGRRRRIDVRWVEQWLATGGYRSSEQESPTQHREAASNHQPLITVERTVRARDKGLDGPQLQPELV